MNKSNMHFEISERKILLRFMDVFCVFVAVFLISNFFEIEYFTSILSSTVSVFLLGFYILAFGSVFDLYNLQTASSQMAIIKPLLLTGFLSATFFLFTPILSPILPSNRTHIVLFYGIVILSLTLWRGFYLVFLASHRFEKRVLFFGPQMEVESLGLELENANPHYKVIGFINTDSNTVSESNVKQVRIEEMLHFITAYTISEIVMVKKFKADFKMSEYVEVLMQALEKGVVVRDYEEVYENTTYRLPILNKDKDSFDFFPYSRSNTNKLYLFTVRFMDVLFSLIGIIGFLILLPLLLVLNLIGNPGPLFYRQERVGKNGKSFMVYKLRSMVTDAERNGAVFAQKNDARITPFGKFIRKTRLDEIPQFLNILKGEMSLIGPRPERPFFVEQIAEVMPLYRSRHVVKPGLTGWAQVKYSYGSSIDDSLVKLQYDLFYIKNRSLSLDLNIVIKTLNTVLFFRGQ